MRFHKKVEADKLCFFFCTIKACFTILCDLENVEDYD